MTLWLQLKLIVGSSFLTVSVSFQGWFTRQSSLSSQHSGCTASTPTHVLEVTSPFSPVCMLDVCGPGGTPHPRLGTQCPCTAVFIYFLKLHGFFASGNPPHSLVMKPELQEIVHFLQREWMFSLTILSGRKGSWERNKRYGSGKRLLACLKGQCEDVQSLSRESHLWKTRERYEQGRQFAWEVLTLDGAVEHVQGLGSWCKITTRK